MKELIEKQEKVVTKLQERLLERLANKSPIDTVSECLSRAVEDLGTLNGQPKRSGKAHSG